MSTHSLRMTQSKKNRFTTKLSTALRLFSLVAISHCSFSQQTDSAQVVSNFGGSITATNNGISLLPAFSLGRPAAMVELTVGRKLTFEPAFRVALEGKPWSFVFWWRYKLLKTDKFRINVGGHPSVVFRTVSATINGVTKEVLISQRYLAGELAPSFWPTKNIGIGLYYFRSHGFEKDAIRNTNFFGVNTNFANIKLSKQFFMRFSSQVYYLKMDDNDGYYATSTITLAKKNFPFSISSILNKAIETNIPIGKDFTWNLSLVYTFNKSYVEYVEPL